MKTKLNALPLIFTALFAFCMKGFAKNYADNEVIVKFKTGKQGYAAIASAACGATKSEDLGDGQTQKLILNGKGNVEDVVAMLNAAKDEVEYAEPNYKRYLPRKSSAASTDNTQQKREVSIPATTSSNQEGTGDKLQWNLKTMQVKHARTLLGRRSDVIVAVLDTGVDVKHPALLSQMLVGYDAPLDSNDPACYADRDGHGTHCAGIVAAQKINQNGIQGIASHCKIFPVRVIEQTEGYVSWSAAGIRKAVDSGAKVITMSYGSVDFSNAEKEAVEYAYSKGVMLFAASGNDGKKNYVSYPACYDNVISVGATNESDRKAKFSNYGDNVNIYAPGKNIISTILGGFYAQLDGTSMACPSVAAVAALIFSIKPDLRPAQVWGVLESTAEKLNDPNAGAILRVNALKAVEAVVKKFCPERLFEPSELCVSEKNTASQEIKMIDIPATFDPSLICQSYINADEQHQAKVVASFPFDRTGKTKHELALQLELVSDRAISGSLELLNVKTQQYVHLGDFTVPDGQKAHFVEYICKGITDDFFDSSGRVRFSFVATADKVKKVIFIFSKEHEPFTLQINKMRLVSLNSL
jgi:thermitase